jgi:hypothetical protein
VSLRGHPVEEAATLPNGTRVSVHVAVADDPYVAARELDTVALELRTGDEVLASVNTVLEPEHTSEARALAREVAEALVSGQLEPTAGALEPFAARIPPVRE